MPLKIITSWEEARPDLDDIAGAIIRDVCPLLSTPQGAPHTVSREFSCYVDYLGALFCGTRKDKKGKAELVEVGERFRTFLDVVMFLADPAYRDKKELIYQMYRCGPVHEFDPKVLVNSAGQELRWFEYRGQREDFYKEWRKKIRHLEAVRAPKKATVYYLPVSTICLVQDLLISIEQFRGGLGRPTEMVKKWNEAAAVLNAPKRFDFSVS